MINLYNYKKRPQFCQPRSLSIFMDICKRMKPILAKDEQLHQPLPPPYQKHRLLPNHLGYD